MTVSFKNAIIYDTVTNINIQVQTKAVLIDTIDLGALHKLNGAVHPDTGEHLTPMEAAQIKAEELGAFAVYISWNHEDVASHNSMVARQNSGPNRRSGQASDYRVAVMAKVIDEVEDETQQAQNPVNPFEK